MTLRLEVLRLWRSRRPQLALLGIAFFLGLMLVGFYTYAQSRTGGNAEFRYTYENRSYFNGLTFAVYAFYFGSLLVLPVFAATEGGVQIAGETSSGTLFLLLTRPIGRARLFLTKFLVAAALSFLLAGALLGAALGIGLVAVGWGDLTLYPGVLQMTEARQDLSQAVALGRFALVWPAASLALLAPLSLSFLISAWSRSAVNAVGASVVLYLVLYIVSEIHFFQELRPWIFTSDVAYWRGLFQERIPWGDLGESAARLLGFSALFTALAYRRFRIREEP